LENRPHMNSKDEKKTIKLQGYSPISWQQEAHKALAEHASGLTLVVKAHRQVGKTMFICNALLFNSVNYAGSVSYFIAPTWTQSRKVFRELVKSMAGIPILKASNETLLSISFINGSEIYLKSAEQSDGALRGFTCKKRGLLCIDEAAYISMDVFANVMNYTNVNNNNVIIVSTPKFESGFFYDLFCKGLSGVDKNVISIDVNNYDTSMFLSDEKKAFYKVTMPTLMYQTDILGLFIKESSAVFGEFNHACSNKFNTDNTDYYFGVDWGTGNGNDRTAISIFNGLKQQVAMHYFDDKDPNETIEYILKLTEEYHPKKITVEKNSIGDVFGKLLRKELMQKHPKTSFRFFITDNNSKNRIVGQLQVAINNKAIQLLDDTQLKIEMVNYEVQKTPTGKVTYNAASGQHDDCLMATMICLDSIMHKNELYVA